MGSLRVGLTQYSIVYVYCIFLIHSSVGGRLSCFYDLTVVNSAAMNIGVHISVFLDVYSGVDLLDHMVVLFLCFWGTCVLFSIGAVLGHSVQGFPFLYILTNICYLQTFPNSHFDRCKVIVHCCFDLHLATSLSLFTFMHCRRKWQPTPVFLPGESQGRRSLVGCHLWGRTESDTTEATRQQQQQFVMSSIFSCAYWPSVGLLWRNVSSGLLPYFGLGCLNN